jgi:UDP-N-acetylenolpyruvoylglucosamine reductase
MTLADPITSGNTGTFDGGDDLARKISAQTVLRRDEPLAKRTTLRVGGPAQWYVEPATEADLSSVLQFCAERQVPFFVLGRGSNLLVKDRGFRGVVVCLAHPSFSRIELNGQDLYCGAGARLKAVAVEAKRHNLAGLEFLEGIPGSVGGALRMNAGAMGGQMFDQVTSVRVMNLAGHIEICQPADMAVSYRRCEALRSQVALGAVLRGRSGVRAEIEQRMNEFSRKRWQSQPAAPSAGCMFKNPAVIPAGRLIDELGLKGTRVGGAMVSLEHGNFLVNDGTATAQDVLALIELIQRRARSERGIELETEVEIIGE